MSDENVTKERTTAETIQPILDAHRKLVVSLTTATLALGVPLLVAMLWLNYTGNGPTVMVATMFGGSLGAYVSALKRLYGFQDIFPDRSYAALFGKLDGYVAVYSMVPAVVGMIGAGVIYVVFAAGLLSGPLFPNFKCVANQTCDTFASFVRYWTPEKPTDYAKVIAWGFVAGFSERFVPDVLNRLGTKSGAEEANSRR